jgi:hypothetical protein
LEDFPVFFLTGLGVVALGAGGGFVWSLNVIVVLFLHWVHQLLWSVHKL